MAQQGDEWDFRRVIEPSANEGRSIAGLAGRR
jgi:hypothetical protein